MDVSVATCPLCGQSARPDGVRVGGATLCRACLDACARAARAVCTREKEAWLASHADGWRQPSFQTTSGIPVDMVYTPADVAPQERERVGWPGAFPFTRGVQATMYRGRLWTMRQYAGFGTAQETNERFRYLLAQGQTGLSCAFDLPTQMGYDSDDAAVVGEVGRVGVAIDSLADMETLLADIPLDQVSLSMTINAPASVLLAMVLAVARKRGIPFADLTGTVQNDILKEYVARGTYIFPLAQSMRLCADIIEYCMEHVPRWNPISISGYHMREAGCTAAQEVAFTLQNGLVYLEEVLKRGIPIDGFASRLSFFFAAWNELFEEVAKFRVARRLWAGLLKERYGAEDKRSLALRFHTQTAGSALTAQQPLNNVVRVTVQALAAVLGGTQSLHTNSYDEALALPTEASTLLALRTQQVLAYETGVADTVDPLGGSWYIESLTDSLEKRVKDTFTEIGRRGGMLACIEDGWVQRQIHQSAYAFQQAIETGAQVQVGVNEFTGGTDVAGPSFKLDPTLEPAQKERVQAVRQSRDGARVERALDALEAAAAGTTNLMPYILEAVEAMATVGEICGRLRRKWGTYRPASAF